MGSYTFAGGWLSKQFSTTPPELLHQADARHAASEPGDPTVGAWAGPPILGTDPAPFIYEHVDWVVHTPGSTIDTTPVDHYLGSPSENFTEGFTAPGGAAPGDVDMQRAAAAAHAQDYGSSRKLNYDVPPFQDSTERVLQPRFEGVGPVGDLIPALAGGGQRGLNGLSVNNPPLEMYQGRGYRWGWVEQLFVDRKMYDPTRVHDERLTLPNTAAPATSAPVPADAGPYNSPWATLARPITNVAQRPLMRRQPPAVDQSIMDDGEISYDPYYSDSWVVR